MYGISQKSLTKDQEAGDFLLTSEKKKQGDDEGPSELPPTVYSAPVAMAMEHPASVDTEEKEALNSKSAVGGWKRKSSEQTKPPQAGPSQGDVPQAGGSTEGVVAPPSRSMRQPEEGLAPLQVPSYGIAQEPPVQLQTAPSSRPPMDQATPGPDEPVLEAILTDDFRHQARMEREVTAMEIRADVSKESRQRRRWITIIVVLVVVVGAALGTSLGIVFGRGDDDDGPMTPVPSNMPTLSPSFAPTEAPTSFAFSEVASLVESIFGNILEDSTSAQYRAADWMAHVDTFLDLSVVTPERFMQRYAIVVLYFATGGDVSWTSQANFLIPDAHECLWFEPVVDSSFTVFGNRGVAGCSATLEVFIIELIDNNLSGSLPPELSALTNLDFLLLNVNNIGGTLPPELFTLSTLQVLWIPFNDFSGTIATEIGNLEALELLWLRETSLTGTMPSEMGRISNLAALTLSFGKVNGTIPEGLFDLSSMVNFDLNTNQLTGTLPSSVSSIWPNIETFTINFNKVSGVLPSDLGSLTTLTSFSVQNNSFVGKFPQSFVNLEAMAISSFSDNALTGRLPNDWSRLTDLALMSFQDNRLTGTLPPSIGGLGNLTTVDFSGNLFNGSIPLEFANLSSMELIAFQDNLLTGTVPSFFGDFLSLQFATFTGNMFVGDMSFFCNAMNETINPLLTVLTADCLGEVTCPCCFICCNEAGECVNQ